MNNYTVPRFVLSLLYPIDCPTRKRPLEKFALGNQRAHEDLSSRELLLKYCFQLFNVPFLESSLRVNEIALPRDDVGPGDSLFGKA